MGGRGASSGKYHRGGKVMHYGDEYQMVHESRNIKFVQVKQGSTSAPMETQTQGRIYATLNAENKIKSITYYRGNGNRRKQIDMDHVHNMDGKKLIPHTHSGYLHDEHGTREPTKREKKMIDRVIKIWENRNRQ